jgi:hypothetical protein
VTRRSCGKGWLSCPSAVSVAYAAVREVVPGGSSPAAAIRAGAMGGPVAGRLAIRSLKDPVVAAMYC